MPKMNVNKSITINKPASEVFKHLNDFNNWMPWSPWLIMEPGVDVDVEEDGKHYKWKGEIVGSGEMTVLDEKENESINYDLTFLTPYKSKAKVGFELDEKNGETNLTWTMQSKLPFFLFWMKKSMEAFIGMDYKRGLEMLKDQVEDGKVHSELNFKGHNTFEGTKYIGIQRNTTMDDIDEHMSSDYEKLMHYIHENHEEKINGDAFSIYHKWNIPKKIVSYTACIPVKSVPSDLPADFISGELPTIDVHTVHHKGPYRHVGNAWTAQQMYMRAKKFRYNKRIDPFEVYLNSPQNTDEKELESEIHFAIK